MYAAMSQHQYSYAAPVVTGRQHNYGTSSAFSSSANPDEDWTKISDLAERRRIQNRIAQRNYRKKLKRRLEDLERRAGPADGPSALGEKMGQLGAANKQAIKRAEKQAAKQQQQQQQTGPSPSQQPPQSVVVPSPNQKLPASQFTPPMSHEDDLLFNSAYGHHHGAAHQDERERSHTPPFFSYSTYPPPDEMMAPYGGSQPTPAYRGHPAVVTTAAEAYPDYLTASAVPVTLPSMSHFNDAIKREGSGGFPGDDGLNPYMNYGFLPGIDMNANPYDHSNPHTPPLSHSFDHSANCSDSGYEYPTTPLSMPGSPGLMQH